jgi:Ca2+-binding EF-hand superfamily protein
MERQPQPEPGSEAATAVEREALETTQRPPQPEPEPEQRPPQPEPEPEQASAPATTTSDDSGAGDYSAALRRSAAPELDEAQRTQVLKDIPRTFPKHPQFAVEQGIEPPVPDVATGRLRVTWRAAAGESSSLVEPLVNVLMAVVADTPSVGYTQGLNFVAATLLLKHDEAAAFARLAALMRLYPGFYGRDPDMRASLVESGVLEAMCAHTPAGRHIEQLQPGLITVYASQWLVPLFSNVMPDPAAALHVLEFLGSAGSPPHALTRLTLAMLETREAEILATQDPGALHELIKQLPASITDAPGLCALAASAELVGCDQIEAEWSSIVARVEGDMVRMERRERTMNAFKAIDTNGDRQLGFNEFKQLLLHHQAAASGGDGANDSDASGAPPLPQQAQANDQEEEEAEEEALARALFEQIDTDRSGEVSFHELSRVSSLVGHFAPLPTTRTPTAEWRHALPEEEGGGGGGALHRQRSTAAWTTAMFNSIDVDGDGTISKGEMRVLVRKIYSARDGILPTVSETEGGSAVTAGLRELAPVEEMELDRVFEAADTDQSGGIDSDEFAAVASNTPFLLTGLQLLSVQERLQQERERDDAERNRADDAVAAAAEYACHRQPEGASRWCNCFSPAVSSASLQAPATSRLPQTQPSPDAEEGVPPSYA